MKVTAIRHQAKNVERANIFLDGKYAFSLGLNELVAEKLKPGLELAEAEVARLKKLSADGKLKARVLEWVMNRPRSTRELRDYLYRKKVSAEQITALTEEFTQRGYLSDEHFAVWLVDMRRRAGKSERAIRAELMKKGVGREVAAESLRQEDGDERERLRALIAKKQNLSRYKNDPQKFKQFLLRQGFNYDDINALLGDKN